MKGTELIKINNNGNVEMTSKDIAKYFGKKHSHVLRDVRKESKNCGININEHNPYFGLSYYKDSNNRKRKQYILTKKGILLIAARYSSKLRMKLINKIEELEKNKNESLNLLKATENLLNVAADHGKKIHELEYKVDNQITIDHGEQRQIRKAVNKRVTNRLGGKDSKRYKNAKVRSKYYSSIYGTIYESFNVSSYRDIKVKDLKDCLKMIRGWVEPAKLRIRAVK